MNTRSLLPVALAAVMTMGLTAPCAADVDTDGDGIPDRIKTDLGLVPGVPQVFVPIATSPDRGYTEEEAKLHAPDILSVEASHVGEQRVVIKTTFARPPDFVGATFIIYVDVDADKETGRVDDHHGGTDVMVVLRGHTLTFSMFGSCTPENTGARTAVVDDVLYVALDAPFAQTDDAVRLGLHLLSQREGGRGDTTPHVVVDLPRSTLEVPSLPLGRPGTTRPLSDFRYHDDKVAYERLSDKGLRREQVTPPDPIEFGRPRPQPLFASEGREDRDGNVDFHRVPVELLEEAGVTRQAAALTFGFPLPQGALYRLEAIRLLDGEAEVPAQFTATVFWPDDSLKWVLVDATVPLAAQERRELTMEFGNDVRRAPDPQALPPFTLPDEAEIVLVDEHGTRFTGDFSGPGVVEKPGPYEEVVRHEGRYVAEDGADYMRFTARFTRRAGSPLVQVALTHVNDYLETEFTDFTSLGLSVGLPGDTGDVRTYVEGPEGALAEGPAEGLVQLDDTRLASGPGRGAGVITWDGGGAVVHDFWQRWPKGVSAADGRLVFDLLPPQPGPEYGTDLPYHLMYPFVEGFYRLKWGMSFTERLSLDLSGAMSAEELWAEAQLPVVAVIPADWYARTGALGTLAAPRDNQFAMWDELVGHSFDSYLHSREAAREYGFLNYGDWFGERGRNWGNNEYDLPHGLFMQFARTGNRDYFRWALAGVRHQADVDCVHAYPDPYYVGGNHLHSVGHTGSWDHRRRHGTWSFRYDFHTSAANGHTWTDGMMNAWQMAGDARVMDAAIGVGEHIAWAMSPGFNRLGTHERSAGWSLRAIMALYRGTYDPIYLEAAERIAAVALQEQQFDNGGAWPHVLPQDHAGGHDGAVGNNLFLIGVLLSGLQAYHQESQDPAVLRSLEAGVDWVVKSFDETVGGWPYSASPEGEPYYEPRANLNQLIIGPVAYVGRLTGNERLLQIVDRAFEATVSHGSGGFGKSIAQVMFFTSEVLGELQQWYAATREDEGRSVLDGSPEMMAELLLRSARTDRHGVRAPDEKVFSVRLRAPQAQLTASRTPHGAMTKRAEFGTLRVYDAEGDVVARDEFSTDDPHEFTTALPGDAGAQYRVVIDDDQRGVWTLDGDAVDVVMHIVPNFRIGGVGRSLFSFHVPAGTTQFTIRLLGVHTGPYEAVVLGPDDEPVEHFRNHNPGGALIAGAPPGPQVRGHPERGEVTVQVAPEQAGRMWSVILAAAIDIGVQLEGVPPFMSRTPDEWFHPQ